jgi:hypothetical protein
MQSKPVLLCLVICTDSLIESLIDSSVRVIDCMLSHGCRATILVYTILLLYTWITLLEFTEDIQCRRLWVTVLLDQCGKLARYMWIIVGEVLIGRISKVFVTGYLDREYEVDCMGWTY